VRRRDLARAAPARCRGRRAAPRGVAPAIRNFDLPIASLPYVGWHRSARALVSWLLVVTAGALAGCDPASAAWSPAQQLSTRGADDPDAGLASNARGDAVLAYSDGRGVWAVRAAAHRGFGRPERISGGGGYPLVAIDEQGVVLVALTYDDESYDGGSNPEGACCLGVKVSVWRPGHRPSRPRAILPEGSSPTPVAIAAGSGRRGLVINAEGAGPVRFVPVSINGRVGRLRAVAAFTWEPSTLAFVDGRAVVGLIRREHYGLTTLATARQRPGGTFAPEQRFVRTGMSLGISLDDDREVDMSADGRGGQVAVWVRGRGRRLGFVVTRKPFSGQARSVAVAPAAGSATRLFFSTPAVAIDGSIVLPWVRVPKRGLHVAYCFVQRPDGSVTNTRLPGGSEVLDLVGAAAPGGSGAVVVQTVDATTVAAIRYGRPRLRESLGATIRTTRFGAVWLTGNGLDPARAVFHRRSRRFASLLR